MEKFTEGEWVARYDSAKNRYSEGAISADGHDIAIITGYNFDCVFGGRRRDFSDGYEEQDHQEHAANAHIIAAAPKTYYKLKEVEQYLDAMIGEPSYSKTLHDEVINLLAECRGEHEQVK